MTLFFEWDPAKARRNLAKHRVSFHDASTAFVKSKGGGVDFRLVTVHLYWGHNKSRYAEAVKLNGWVKT